MTRGARMLVVDDEPQIVRSLRTALTAAGYDIQTAATGEEALRLLQGRLPDLVILDLVLPGISGLEVCRRLRERSAVPILVLSARGEERDKLAALDLGADNYLTKPFGVEELLARIRAALRRAAGLRGPSTVIAAGDLRVDVDRRLVTRMGVKVHLTATQFELLKTLVVHAGRVLTHAYLLRTVWGPSTRARPRCCASSSPSCGARSSRTRHTPLPAARPFLLLRSARQRHVTPTVLTIEV